MKHKNYHRFFIVLVLIILDNFKCTSKPVLKQLQNCDLKTNYDILYNATFSTLNGKQYLNGWFWLKIPFDDTLRINATVDLQTGKAFTRILDVVENKACTTYHKFFGEFAYDLERYMQQLAGGCPIPKGKHYVHNGELNLRKVNTLAAFPLGTLRLVNRLYDKDNEIVACLDVIVQNQL